MILLTYFICRTDLSILPFPFILIKAEMIKNQANNDNPPIYKKIQNYIFKFSDLLGQGNFSKVYKASKQNTTEVVAIKIVQLQSLKSKKLEQLLFSQIDVLKKLNHPNVLRCFEVFTSNRNCYIITELCNQGDLQSRLRKDRYFDEYRAEPIIKDIFNGLYYLAQKDVIHRDLKVANVFMHNGHAKIADFGFAKFTKQKFKDINIGSPIYMSPQGFIHNVYGPKTDIWAFGVLIYELLHGQTPFSFCKSEAELKQSLSIPISKSKFRAELSVEIKQVIMKCMEIDENKRISIFQLALLPYFQRLSKKQPHSHNNYHGSAYDLRIRAPSYNGQNQKFLKSDQAQIKRKISIQKPNEQYGPLLFKATLSPHFEKAQMGYPASGTRPLLQLPAEEKSRRAMSSEKVLVHMMQPDLRKQQRSPVKQAQQTPKSGQFRFQILSGYLSFKQCVNVLHYGRLIFKFLLTLKVSQYINDKQLVQLSKWLMELLSEINQKIQRKEIAYQGQNSNLREQKLKQVRNEYQKKYRIQLQNYIRLQPFGVQPYSLNYMKNFFYTLYTKYDQLLSREQNKSAIMLGHCIIMICDVTRLLKQCYQEKNYKTLLQYKDIQNFLSLSKDQIDINSYHNYRKRMANYSYQ